MKDERLKVIITCEHGGNSIPPEYAQAFKQAKQVISSHRGWDKGALELFQSFQETADFTLASTTSRLVVELNRSIHHPKLFSEFMLPLSTSQSEQVLKQHYYPYRQEVEKQISDWVANDFTVLHLSVHTFTPELSGKVRKADIGLLYDPKREKEQLFAARWRQQLQLNHPEFRIRYNYPYKGTADGFVTYLRKHFTNEQYAGIELEVNQQYPESKLTEWQELKQVLVQTFTKAL